MSDITPVSQPASSSAPSPIPAWLHELAWAERFELLERIGSGGMGQVWRAREHQTDRVVALKILDPGRSGDEHLLARLDIEAATLVKLRDAGRLEGIVPIIEFKITDSFAALVMDFIPGMTLSRWCDSQRLDLQKRVKVVAQTARAAGWFHELGVIHRDLKPANILVSALTHEPVIVDFSIAKLDENLPITLTVEAIGTAPYMAPEQFVRELGAASPASDVYALGAVLYELLTHVLPHPGDAAQIMRRHLDQTTPARPSILNPEIPRDLDSIIVKALSHEPRERYPSGRELAEDLERFLEGRPVMARPVSRVVHVVRQVRRRPALTAALAACMMLLGLVWWSKGQQAAREHRFNLETRLGTAMQRDTWSAGELEQTENDLVSLAREDTAMAVSLRQRFHDDVVRDMEVMLQQKHLRDEDFAWLGRTAEWLKPRSPDHAGRLQRLTAERAGRWETQAELRAPFADRQGLFPVSKVRQDGDLLYPMYDDSLGQEAPITITKAVSVPMEASCTFVAQTASFQSITLVFYHESSRVSAGLHKVRHLPKPVLHSPDFSGADPESYALVLSHNSNFKRALHIPDTHLLDRSFRVTLRVEREWAEADVNGQSRLRVDSAFALGSDKARNYWRITWPKDIGLEDLVLRTRRSDTVSPLEEADLLAMQGRWAEARRLYEDLRGDPLFGDEAGYKMGECSHRQGDVQAAFTIWERLVRSPSSRWRDRSVLQLWVESVLRRDHDSAARYLGMLPESELQGMLQQFDPSRLDEITDACARVGMNIAGPRVDAGAVTEAAKALRLLQVPKVQTANRLAMAHHFARLDDEAHAFYRKGLADPAGSTLAVNLLAGTNCLDQWCRIVPSEKNRELSKALDLWKKTLPDNPTVRAVWHMERARSAARSGDADKALVDARAAHEDASADNRVLTSAWLLEGMLRRLHGDEDAAQAAWQEALKMASTVTMKHPLHLMDCILLHCLTKNWDLQSAGDLLTNLAGRHLDGTERTTARAAAVQTLFSDHAWITALNAALKSRAGLLFARDYILCQDPPRELVQRFYRLLLERYFISTGLPDATAGQIARVRGLVNQLVTEMATNPQGVSGVFTPFIGDWNDPKAAAALEARTLPCSSTLGAELKWLLGERHAGPRSHAAE